MRAIDLYSGIGGWSIGLNLAGIEVVAAYERWQPAIETYRKNLGEHVLPTDIRAMDLTSLPGDIDIVVGSPPCTQFSYSNRGGNGDIEDGLRDIKAFLAIVEHLAPRYWVMENVPRVKGIIENELASGGELAQYEHLVESIDVIDMSEFGLPQKRRRCIAGRYPHDLLLSYRKRCKRRSLGEVLRSLDCGTVSDLIYAKELARDLVTDHQTEPHLTSEEVRLNRDNKTRHPVYNGMRFPENLTEPARTLTATCTKVSRESLIVESPSTLEAYRRLTIRERACLQSFPIDFKFFGESYSGKVKMIGNAIPPLFSYYVGCSLAKISEDQLVRPSDQDIPSYAEEEPPNTPPERSVSRYPERRRFRAVIPYLRFGSGTRFELTNSFDNDQPSWRVSFLFGTPKDIWTLPLNGETASVLRLLKGYGKYSSILDEIGAGFGRQIASTSERGIQEAWCHRTVGLGPHQIADDLSDIAERLAKTISEKDSTQTYDIISDALQRFWFANKSVPNERKIRERGTEILSGLFVGTWFNELVSLGKSNEAQLAAAE